MSFPSVKIAVVINCLLLTVSPTKPMSTIEISKNLPMSGLAEVFRQLSTLLKCIQIA